MEIALLEEIATRYAGGLPKEVAKKLADVEIMVCLTPEHATEEMETEFEEKMDPPVPADCKGMFVGEPLSEEEGDDGEEVYVELPEGFIVLVASNIASAEEAGLVLMHETGHALGMDEEEVKALGLGVGKDAPKPAPESTSGEGQPARP